MLLMYHNLTKLYHKGKEIAKITPRSGKTSDYLPNCLKFSFETQLGVSITDLFSVCL